MVKPFSRNNERIDQSHIRRLRKLYSGVGGRAPKPIPSDEERRACKEVISRYYSGLRKAGL